jgi:hypothetical protein
VAGGPLWVQKHAITVLEELLNELVVTTLTGSAIVEGLFSSGGKLRTSRALSKRPKKIQDSGVSVK